MSAAALPRQAQHETGFTLAELLVALALFALVSSLIAGVVNLIARLDGAAQRQNDAAEQVVSAQTVLRARLEQMRPVIDPRGLGDTIAIVGSREELTFTAPGLAANGAHQVQAIRLRRTPRGEFVLYSAPLLAGFDLRAPSVRGWSAVPLLDGVRSIEIAYFGAERASGRDAWQDRWLNRAQPPKLVRVRLGFAEGDPRSWPVLMVRPMSGVRLACQDGRKSFDCGEAP
ncbi:prepilin-type N-terminal cleavage/methylation domain-containing protein [Novosphingobium sp.]|uniref:prepilin-type N-terminal cleavage/methylation domain-containing protein n=1 Tax=Novosphingobium sp. TaxID=1874826 RepID=UPI001DD7440A|nr:prepilin-type N-terminal cleavage/methylation domain-containing protein [Novosphingobium sp.]MBX9665292.1 prepilin-type N-terminal cleavage/methylation domain-containing protein [Novosphingobium sp.]